MRASSVRLLALAAVLSSCAPRSLAEHQQRQVAELESRLVAPCCWMQTLDIHESPLARSLRDEITARIARGEAPQAIEEDLVIRHGERIRAVARGADLGGAKWAAAGVAILALGAGLMVARRWVGRGRDLAAHSAAAAAAPAPGAEIAAGDRRLEDLLDDELDAAD
jgi:cytochrome c-type biogenesis protein CcmH